MNGWPSTRAREWLGQVALGTVLLFAGVTLSVVVVGPVVRRWAGPPFDYGSDYTSPSAFWHSLAVVTGTLASGYAILGWFAAALGREVPWATAVRLAHPIGVAVASVVASALLDGAYVLDGQVTWEYIGPPMMFAQMCLCIPAYAGALWLGTRAGRRA